MIRWIWIGMCILMLAFIGAGGFLLSAACRRARAVSGRTVVVLGCRVRGVRPGKMLTKRLETARAVLQENPALLCVVSGGQGPDEGCTEAAAMKEWLTAHGIAAHRIYTEEESVNTEQNLRYTARLIRQTGLSSRVLLVTDGFHMYRSGRYAHAVGLHAAYWPVRTALRFLPKFWCRETAAVWVLWLFGRKWNQNG